jgi:hypothetical protein
VAETALFAPQRVQTTLADADRDAPWRAELGIAEPSPQLSQAIASLGQSVRAVTVGADDSTRDGLLGAFPHNPTGDQGRDRLATHVLVSALKARQVRMAEGRAVRGDILAYALA